jgi:hypothetical protein
VSFYPITSEHRRVRKLSVSLPEDLVEHVERRAAESKVGFSTALAEIVRAEMDAEDQARLEAALALDAEDNLVLARATLPIAAALTKSLEW